MQDVIRQYRCWPRLDPSLGGGALDAWADRMFEVPVTSLTPGHSDVSPQFLHGPHMGQRVEDLTRELFHADEEERKTLIRNITPLVAVEYDGRLIVVFGNRRLKALHDYTQQTQRLGDPPKARVIVHRFPFTYMDADMRLAFIAKVVLAYTHCGRPVSFRARRR